MTDPVFTLADHQLERDRLRLVRVSAEVEELAAATVDTRRAVAAGLATRAVVRQALAALAGRWLRAIAGERDETRLHYLLSDTLHDAMRELAARLPAASDALPLVGQRLARGLRPRPILTVSQWADRYRILDSGTNAPGPWRTALTPYLRAIQDDLSEHSPTRTIVFCKSSGLGAPLDIATPIATSQGWTTMGEIQIGDQVFDEAGQPCRVVMVEPIHAGRDCYEITFSDGATLVSDGEHRWSVHDAFPGHHGKVKGVHRQMTIKTTAEIATTYLFTHGRRRYSIPVAGPLDLPERDDLLIPPYVLGFWLADGNSYANQCTKDEGDVDELAHHLSADGWTATARRPDWQKGRAANIMLHIDDALPVAGECLRGHRREEVGTYQTPAGQLSCAECHRQHAMAFKYDKPLDPILRAPGFITRLKDLGIYAAKRIPDRYQRASAAQRLALLQGLLDGDGSITREGHIEYSTANATLADEVMALITGLGFKPGLCVVTATSGYRRLRDRPPTEHYRINFHAYADRPVFRLARKLARQRPATGGNPTIVGRRFIVGVRPVPSRPVRCIGVDSPSHLYLCGRALIPTHNTEAMNNWIGYLMHHLQNKDALIVVPTLEMRDRSLNPRLNKMIAESPALAALTVTAARNKANRGDLLEFGAGARLIKSGANSPDSLRSDHLPYVICDEVDAFPWDVGDEGDPMTLIENRQRTFTRAKTYLISTPTLSGKSRIDLMYQRSDMRRYQVPCPHCGHYQPLLWEQLKYRTAPPPADDPHPIPQVLEAWYLCQECGAEISESHKPAMLAAGRWVARRPHISHTHGYHLNALYAPLGLGLNWVQVAQKWCNSQGDSAELKSFVNTYLGEVWKEQGDSIDDVSLITRREDYHLADLAYGLITAGVDVQKDRLEATIVAWGVGEEAWVIDHHILAGDTTDPDLWQELAETLTSYPVDMAAIDSGYNASLVYDFVRPRRWARAVKGFAGLGRPLVEDLKRRLQRLRRRSRTGVILEPLGVDQGKGLLYARLKLAKPGPGYIHFPNSPACDEEYFAQLAAERLVTKFRGHRPIQEWVATRARNESLDCYDADTEVLTRDGWRLFRAVGLADELATVCLDTDRLEYQRPLALIAKPYQGEMVQLKGDRIDILVTPNHRMVTLKKRNETISRGVRRWRFDVPAEITLAKDLTVHHAIKITCQWDGQPNAPVVIPASYSVQGNLLSPARHLDPVRWATFLGWWIAEGSTAALKGRNPGSIMRRVTISQTKPDGVAAIAALLAELPWAFSYHAPNFSITSKQLFDYLQPFGRYQHERRVPQWIKDASPAVIAAFLEAAIAGDGWTQQKQPHHRPSRAYATTSRLLADDIQELLIKIGRAATLRVVQPPDWLIRGRSGESRRQYHVYERLGSRAYLDGGKGGRRGYFGVTVPYDGWVYCATVPNGTLVVRRGGKTFIAGNCLVYSLAAQRLIPGDLDQAVRARQAQRAPQHDPAQAPQVAMPPPAPTARRRGGGFVKGWR